jgi:sec-independent protein translocase protein TatB
MFDIGFSEIVVIGVVALIVIGPERLPKTARMLGHLFGRLQRYVNEVKADINREMELDELRHLQREVKSAAGDLEQSMRGMASDFRSGVRNVEQQLNQAASGAADPLPSPESAAPAAAASPDAVLASPGGAAEAPRQGSLPGFDKI